MYLREHGQTSGPWDPQLVRSSLLAGQRAPTTMSWIPGEQRWQSLGARWRIGRRKTLPSGMLVVAAMAILVVSVVLPVVLPDVARIWRWRGNLIALSYAGLILAALGAAGLHAACHRRLNGSAGGLAVLSVFGIGACALTVCGVLALHGRVADARATMGNARLTLSPDARVLTVNGPIGARFMPDLTGILELNRTVARVDISSQGGLIEDALEAGDLLRARGISVRVLDECASACVLLWAHAGTREIPVHARIGLHQSSMAGSAPQPWMAELRRSTDPRVERVLQSAGFSPRLLQRRANTPADSMAWVDAFELQQEGVRARFLTASGEDAGPAELLMARVLSLEGIKGTQRNVFMRFAQVAPDRAQAALDRFEKARLTGTAAEKLAAARHLGKSPKADAMLRGGDAAIVEWGVTFHGLLNEALASRDREGCSTLLGVGKPSESWAARMNEAHAQLLESYGSDAPVRRVGSTRRDRYAGVLGELFRDRVEAGSPPDWNHWTALQRCRLVLAYYDRVLRAPLPEAAAAVRVMEQEVE